MRAAVLLEQRQQPNLTPSTHYWDQAMVDVQRWHDEHKNLVLGITLGRGYVAPPEPTNYYNSDGTLKTVAEWTRNAY